MKTRRQGATDAGGAGMQGVLMAVPFVRPRAKHRTVQRGSGGGELVSRRDRDRKRTV